MKNIKNKKGFMLAEVIIVATVAVVALVSLFTLTNKMFLQYDEKIVYDNVDATYVARGLAENYTKDLISVIFSEKTTHYQTYNLDNSNPNVEFLEKNNVIKAYIVRYNSGSIKEFLDEVDDDSADEDIKIQYHFKNYIDTYINGNDFNDADDYDFIIFVAISDMCETINEKKVCKEDEGNVSYGYYKFKYTININENTDYIQTDETILPTFTISKFSTPNRTLGNGDFCNDDYDDLYGYEFSYSLVKEGIEQTITPKVKFFTSHSLDGDSESIYDGGLLSFNHTNHELKAGRTYAIVYGEYEKNGKTISTEKYCAFENNPYCPKSSTVTIGKILWESPTPNDDEAWYDRVTNTEDMYVGGSFEFKIGKPEDTNNYTYQFLSWDIRNCNDNEEYGTIETNEGEYFIINGVKEEDNITEYYDKTGDYKISIPNYDFTIQVWGKIEVKEEEEEEDTGSNTGGCLAEGTKVLLANGKYKNIEDIDYNDLLAVFDHETGELTYQYVGWLEKPAISSNYTKVTFSDGTIINFTNNHALFSLDYYEYVTIFDKSKFKVGSKIAKYEDNKIKEVIVSDIETINEEIKYYHILTNRHFNVVANDLLTVNKEVFVSNFHGFNKDLTWKIPRITDIYSYDALSEVPYYMYRGLRLYEGKYFLNYGMDKNEYLDFLKDFILNEEKTLKPKLNENGKRQWMVTTSDDIVTEDNKLSYLMEEGDYYTLKEPINKSINNKRFIGWLHTGENIMYKPGDKVEVLYGTHFIAKYQDLFNKFNGSDLF